MINRCDWIYEICVMYEDDNVTEDGYLIVTSCEDCPYYPANRLKLRSITDEK